MKQTNTIILGGGCFWCIEAVFQDVKGVISCVSGYAGGEVVNPSYRAVCEGDTGHAEVVKIEFDPSVISLTVILDIFWHLHDPTTLNRQGADKGTQYRSAIYYKYDSDLEIIQESKQNLIESGDYSDPIVTEIKELDKFYEAESYHQNYFKTHPEAGYCQVVINPKMAKLRQKYLSELN